MISLLKQLITNTTWIPIWIGNILIWTANKNEMGLIYFLLSMPSKTLLECLNEYIPDHIFKDIVLDPADAKYDNCCIIIDGQGCLWGYKFTKDDERDESLGECIMYPGYKQGINFHKMLRMKMWFGYCCISITPRNIYNASLNKYVHLIINMADMACSYFLPPYSLVGYKVLM